MSESRAFLDMYHGIEQHIDIRSLYDEIERLHSKVEGLETRLYEAEKDLPEWRAPLCSIDHYGNGSFWQNVVRSCLLAAGSMAEDYLNKRLALDAVGTLRKAWHGDDSIPAQRRFWDLYDNMLKGIKER